MPQLNAVLTRVPYMHVHALSIPVFLSNDNYAVVGFHASSTVLEFCTEVPTNQIVARQPASHLCLCSCQASFASAQWTSQGVYRHFEMHACILILLFFYYFILRYALYVSSPSRPRFINEPLVTMQ